jgi:rubrerythrin
MDRRPLTIETEAVMAEDGLDRGAEPPWIAAFAAVPEGDWDNAHLCAMCGCVIEDPLEECPVCAAEYDAGGESAGANEPTR